MRDEAAAEARPTVGAVLACAARVLRDAGVEDPGNDARRLATAALGLSAADMLSRPERLLQACEVEALSRSIARRAAREPVSRILGERSFYGRTFAISPATLDPRPDSETLIETTLEIVEREGRHAQPLRILDVGTGSGCLLLTLLAELPNATGVGTDVSKAALDVARENAQRLGVAGRAEWLASDALEGVEGPFDILVSNPPYIRSGDIAQLAPEVSRFDPYLALDGGNDGLRFFCRLLRRVAAVVPDGWIVLEVGYDQADAVADLLAAGIPVLEPSNIQISRDVTGMRRCVAARARKLSICRESPWILLSSELG
jgi:release factor glutamine methyltransferase